MILLFTDFGAEGPYLGQMEAAIRVAAPDVPVINLVSNAPATEPRLGAYLLAALATSFPQGSIFVCVVDPGVGGKRSPMVLEADGRWFVGPDNGLLNSVAVQAEDTRWRLIEWRPERLSSSFHGRDLFAPVAARISKRDFSWTSGLTRGPDLGAWPADIASIVYFDHYGNAVTGCRHKTELDGKDLVVNGRHLPQASTFCDVPEAQGFWYCNSMGLIEIAANRARAKDHLDLHLGLGFRFDE